MELINLAKRINQKGDEFIQRYGSGLFHEYAAELLSTSSFHKLFNFEELAAHIFSPENAGIQNFRSLEFSDLPITISRGEFCFIDLYFWRRRPTVIHNHHFSGAFMALEGKNVDLEFSFSPSKYIGEHHEFGELALKKEKIVAPGDIVPIAPLDGFIHQNHHQAELTVNMCFRTPEMTGECLSNYLYSGLKFTKNPELLCRTALLLQMLGIGKFAVKDLMLTVDDAISFLIQNHGSKSGNPLFAEVRNYCHAKVLNETGLNISELISIHDEKCDDLMECYE